MRLLHFISFSTFVLIASQTKTLNSGSKTTPRVRNNKEDDINSQFARWKNEHNKTYVNPDKERKAKKAFEQNLKRIQAHNQKKGGTFKTGENDYSDLTYEEKQVKQMGAQEAFKDRKAKRSTHLRAKRDGRPLPDSLDYRSLLTPIRNQGECGACWAFAANAVIEYQLNVKKNMSVPLSDQELIDCNFDEMNCEVGGWPTKAFNYVVKKGVASSKNYQFLGYLNDCLNQRISRVTKINDACELDVGGDDEAMKWIVANYGAVVVSLWSTDDFTSYVSGVYYEADCPHDSANHAVVIVGYGTDQKFGDYWLIRNSWGTSWGIKGYGKFARGSNTCGITRYAMFPCN